MFGAIEMSLSADQEPGSPPPVRGTQPWKMKAPSTGGASSHLSISVNSTQASIAEDENGIWMESGFEQGRLEVELKEIFVGLRAPAQSDKDNLPALGVFDERLRVLSHRENTFCCTAGFYVFGDEEQVSQIDLTH